MEFYSQYLMFLHKGWSTPIVFFGVIVEENETLGCLKSRHLPRLDGLSGSHWNFSKRWHDQTKLCFFLGLSGDIFLFLHLWFKLLNSSLSPPFPPSNLFLLGVFVSKAPSPWRNLGSCFSRISNFDGGVFSFK